MRPYTLSGVLALASAVLFFGPLRHLLELSLADRRYSHLILIPLLSAYFFYRERRRIFGEIAVSPRFALALLAIIPLGLAHSLTLQALAIVAVCAAGFGLCYGPKALKAAKFPLLLLLLLVPIPFPVMDGIISALQRGSAELTYAVFRLADVPMFRQGVRFELPGVGIEIAEECSSIHSGWALFITSLLVGHVFLTSIWTKSSLALLAVPIAMFTNAFRIVTIWFLGTKVNIGFFYGHLHHDGGILFSLVSLSLLLSCLFLFRKLEPR